MGSAFYSPLGKGPLPTTWEVTLYRPLGKCHSTVHLGSALLPSTWEVPSTVHLGSSPLTSTWEVPSTVHFRILHYYLVSKKVIMKIFTTVN